MGFMYIRAYGYSLNAQYIEEDDVRHPHMKSYKAALTGEPLTDSDCEHWLEAIWEQVSRNEKEHVNQRHLIITCSALKRSYREQLRQSCHHAGYSVVHFVWLDAPEPELQRRAEAELGQSSELNLIHSQFETLERPGIEESDATIISVVPPLEDVQNAALDAVSKAFVDKGVHK
ncbi:glucokinase [Metarhizium acridum CQMa 102]|uniref:gluconokinase n=1 Tax=Metarhizium acridum (strain CQMa 102) TaxID=655827 RepID=E9DUD5_METAQ|nr:glucokinase [Metarhizium acridum CQMa 102]EFY92597.1 glucokinase [Metarhizium acridum CQMa 102]